MSSKRKEARRAVVAREAAIARLFSEDRHRRRVGSDADALIQSIPRRRHSAELLERAGRLAPLVRRTKLIDPRNSYRNDPGTTMVYRFGIAEMLAAGDSWVREPESWRPRSHSVHRQFASLCEHLFCTYSVPAFMHEAWFEPRRGRRRRYQRWFIALGRGENIRRCNELPVELTRRAAHIFANDVPSDLSILDAIRFAQFRALGAGPLLIRALLGTRLARDTARDAFWLTVVRFFIEHPMLDRALIGPIVDYIDAMRHGPGNVEPEQPNFCMSGRRPEVLIRQVDNWHRNLHSYGLVRKLVRWQSCGINGLSLIEGRGKRAVRYSISELLSSAALSHEGREMSHCVGSYASSCQSGRIAIFALRAETAEGFKDRLTIAVNVASRMVVEVRGRFNTMPDTNGRRILQIWAQNARLTLSVYAMW